MGFLDDAKDKAESLREQAEQVAKEHGDTVKQGLEKAEDAVRDKLPPERRQQASGLVDKAGDMIDDLAGDDDADARGDRQERSQPQRGQERS